MDLIAAIDAMERAVDGTIPFAAMEVGMLIATQAQTGHSYTNRTGRLEASTRADSVRGSWRNGYTLTVVGATTYGSYLEEGWDTGYSISNAGHVSVTSSQWAFLLPAYERIEAQAEAMIANAMADAVNALNCHGRAQRRR